MQTIPESLYAGNDASYLSLLGYAEQYSAGSAYFNALALNVKLNDGDIPLCCDFVTLQASHSDMVMKDYTAGHISAEDADRLLDTLQNQIAEIPVSFHSGSGYHNLMVVRSRSGEASLSLSADRLTPPNELIGEGIRRHLPVSKELVHIINQAQIILHNHAYNKGANKNKHDPANSIWLWGKGNAPALPSFAGRFQKNASVITEDLLFKGMALSAGMQMASGTNGVDNAHWKTGTVLRELETRDVVYLQFPAAEDASLHGNIDDKILAIEDFDNEVVGELLNALDGKKNVKILLTVNNVSSVVHMRYKKDPVPFVVYPANKGPDSVKQFDEKILKSGSETFHNGPALMEALFRGDL